MQSDKYADIGVRRNLSEKGAREERIPGERISGGGKQYLFFRHFYPATKWFNRAARHDQYDNVLMKNASETRTVKNKCKEKRAIE